MRQVLLVTYDLRMPGKDYDSLYKAIKSIGPWWHYLESIWLIETPLTAAEVCGRLRPHMDSTDMLLAVRIAAPYYGWLPSDAWPWLNDRLT